MKLPLIPLRFVARRGRRVAEVIEGVAPVIGSMTLAEYVERLGAAMRGAPCVQARYAADMALVLATIRLARVRGSR
jgi:hypothetical protein